MNQISKLARKFEIKYKTAQSQNISETIMAAIAQDKLPRLKNFIKNVLKQSQIALLTGGVARKDSWFSENKPVAMIHHSPGTPVEIMNMDLNPINEEISNYLSRLSILTGDGPWTFEVETDKIG